MQPSNLTDLYAKYGVDAPDVRTMSPRERQDAYMMMLQVIGEVHNLFLDVSAEDVKEQFPEDVEGEWWFYNAASHALLSALDAMAGVIDIIQPHVGEEPTEG